MLKWGIKALPSAAAGRVGAQMFSRRQKKGGNKEIFIRKEEEALSTDAQFVATACLFA